MLDDASATQVPRMSCSPEGIGGAVACVAPAPAFSRCCWKQLLLRFEPSFFILFFISLTNFELEIPTFLTAKGPKDKTIAIDLLVNTQTYSKDCEANVSQATAMCVNKDGDYRSQVGRIESSTPMAKGLQVVRVVLDKEMDDLYREKDVTTLHIVATKGEAGGGTYQKSVVFDYSDCHVSYE